MDEKLFLAMVRRLDQMERRIMTRIDSLDAFRFKLIGASIVISFSVGIIAELMRR